MVSPDTQTTSGRVCSPPGRVFCRGFQVQGFPLLWLHTLGFTKNLHNVALQANPSCELVKVYGLKKMSTFLVDNKKKIWRTLSNKRSGEWQIQWWCLSVLKEEEVVTTVVVEKRRGEGRGRREEKEEEEEVEEEEKAVEVVYLHSSSGTNRVTWKLLYWDRAISCAAFWNFAHLSVSDIWEWPRSMASPSLFLAALEFLTLMGALLISPSSICY